MTTSSPSKALAALSLGAQSEEESNPWASKPSEESREEPVVLGTTGPPPPAEEPVFTPAITPLAVDQNVLKEFDPLADTDEKAAQEAWASAESHPPPKAEQSANTSAPQSPTHNKPLPADPESPTKAAPVSASAFTNTFANLARTFTRPRSSGPEALAPSNPRTSAEIGRPATPQTPVRSDSRAKPAEGLFDFQRFLDQLKTKSAEPVSQYLRR